MGRTSAKRGQRERGDSRPLWRTFLNPGWAITAVLVIAFSYLAFTVLAPWQLGKNATTSERNAQLDAAFQMEPVDYEDLFDATGAITSDEEWRRVTLHGHYLRDHEVLLRMRPVSGAPAFEALTPFETTSGAHVLVNRGYVPAENTTVPDIAPAPSGEVTIIAHARKNEPASHREPIHDQGYDQVWDINTGTVSAVTHLTLGSDFVQLATDQPGVLTPQPLPQKTHGPYLSYGLQWIAFGTMAPLGLAYFIYAELKERRRDREEEAAWEAEHNEPPDKGGAAHHTGDIDEPPTADTPPATSEVPARVTPAHHDSTPDNTQAPRKRARYGTSHNHAFYRRAQMDEERF